MNKKKIRMAICYDFDGTLSPYNMQEVSFIPKVGMTPAEFWNKVKENAKKHNMDEILSYMNYMIEAANSNNIVMSEDNLRDFGKDIKLFDGLDSWFERINSYGQEKGMDIEHYVISSGIEEMILGTSIGNKFKHVFACHFVYDKNMAIMPATAVNYTNKTQHLFRINKGIFNYYENNKVNRYTPKEEKYIHFSNMIYIGDGETDVPCMKMVMSQGGYAIAVFNEDKKEVRDEKGNIAEKARKSSKQIALELFEHKRANFIAPTDYSEGTELEKIIKILIDKIEAQARCYEIKDSIQKELDASKLEKK